MRSRESLALNGNVPISFILYDVHGLPAYGVRPGGSYIKFPYGAESIINPTLNSNRCQYTSDYFRLFSRRFSISDNIQSTAALNGNEQSILSNRKTCGIPTVPSETFDDDVGSAIISTPKAV